MKTPDGRPIPPFEADERTMLESWLTFHRATLALKCEGVEGDGIRQASVEPSSMTLLGLVQHMAEVERNWFQRVFSGLDVPSVYEGNKSGFALAPERDLDEALAVWRAEIARGEAICADRSLDDTGTLWKQPVSLRWIYVHLIEEYARHNGHADLIRERLDGKTGA
ncbi:DinB family protein [Streptomyces sp. NBC_01142]|uniref:DinB family protein n=1 Tax=Streptomyces sp. NBC_01142 TaxID=2975865 RepID=UPI0022588B3B|nr:DinB family protein [Streptomyces sp. NBC_01142]MCX4823771.1 DinB family protein [Streptomyces sp. NBC_01142]